MSQELSANPLADFVKSAKTHRRPQSRVEGGFLSFNGKTGAWAMGQEEQDATNAEAIINSATMQHGYVRWGTKPPEKAFSLIFQPYPDKPNSVEGTDYEGRPKTFNAEEARQVTGKFIDDDKDLGQFIFNTSSMGGVENMDKLFDEIVLKAQDGTAFVFPVIVLDNEWYKRSTGKVFKPVFEVVRWCDEDGNVENAKLKAPEAAHDDEPEAEPEPVEEPPKRRRRRRTA